MSDTTEAPVVEAPVAPAATPTTHGATVTPIKPAHHAAAQPRAEDGKFTKPAAPPAPRLIRVDDRDVPEDELLADYRGRRVEHEALTAAQREAAGLRAKLERFSDPLKALTEEQQDAIARARLQRFLEEQEEAKLPPEERARRHAVRKAIEERDALKKQLADRQQAEEQAQDEADRTHAVAMVRSTMKLLGEEERPGVVMREVAAELRAAALQRTEYPPETVAHRVRQRLDTMAVDRVAKMPAAKLVQNPNLVKALNESADPAVLEALAPLIERGRAANLQRLGAAPATPQKPTTGPAPLPAGQNPRTDSEWAAHFKAGHEPKDPREYNIYLRLSDRGALQ